MDRTRIVRDLLPLAAPLAALALLASHGRAQLFESCGFSDQVQPLTLTPRVMATGDVNGDGHKDLVLVAGSGTFSLLVGLGDAKGNLAWQTPIPTALSVDLALADLNLDGKLDAVLLSTCGTPAGCPKLTAALGDGAGGFGAPITTPLTIHTQTTRLAVGDLDGDGVPDVAAASSWQSAGPGALCVAIGSGNGSFTSLPPVLTTGPFRDVAIGDMNHDGKLDVVAALSAVSGAVDVFLGLGNGALAPPIVVSVPGAPYGLAIGDVNHDGNLDAAVCGDSGSMTQGMFTVIDGNGTGMLVPPAQTTACHGVGAFQVVLADLDDDGSLDALTRETQSATFFEGSAPGGFQFAAYLNPFLPIADLRIADLNGDHEPDVLSATTSATFGSFLEVFRWIRAPQFAPTQSTPVGSIVTGLFATGDLDGDGAPDAIAIGSTPTSVQVLKGNGAGALAPLGASHNAGGQPIVAAIADFNGDGRLDVALGRKGPNSVAVLFGDGLGGLGAPTTLASGPTDVGLLAVGDVTGDGRPDLVGSQFYGTPIVALWSSTGPGTFAAAVASFTEDAITAIAAGDLNEDGKADVVTGIFNFDDGNVQLSTGSGLAPYAWFSTVASPGGAAIGDFDGDGHADVMILTGQGAGGVAIHAGDGTGVVPSGVYGYVSTYQDAWSLAPCDVNGDGRVDFLTTGAPQNVPYVFYMSDGAGGYDYEKFLEGIGDNAQPVDLDGDGRLDLAGPSYGAAAILTRRNVMPPMQSTSAFGGGTPGCAGRIGLQAAFKPVVGSPSFGLVATGAPHDALGLCFVANVADPAGFDLFGAKIQVDLFASSFLLGIDAHGGLGGNGFTPLPIPNLPSLAGATLHAQALWIENAKEGWSCSASPFDLVSSRGLTFTVK